MSTFKQFLKEEHDLSQSGYVELLGEVAMFITLNTSHIQSYAADEESKLQLRDMQKNLKNPVLNGMNFIEIYADPLIYKRKSAVPVLLRYIYNLIKYVKPRIERFINPNHVQPFLTRLHKIENRYRDVVSYFDS